MFGGAGFITDMLFGSGGSDPQAFRGPGWDTQGGMLNDYMLSQFMGMYPDLYPQMNSYAGQLGTISPASANRFTPGQAISGQLTPTTFSGSHLLEGQQRLGDLQSQLSNINTANDPSTKYKGPFSGLGRMFQSAREKGLNEDIANQQNANAIAEASQLPDFDVNFQSRNPFQFQGYNWDFQGFDPMKAVGDSFTPQYDIAKRLTQREGTDERAGILEDMNARGMLTTGGTTKAIMTQRDRQSNRLADIASQLAAQQGQQQLGAFQFGANLNTQQQGMQQQSDFARQQAQAEELFRQQGASDQQAQFLAQTALQKRQQQLQQQNQAFNQQTGARQLALGEYGLQNEMQRQPMNDLFRLYQLSTGGQPGSQGSPGLIGSAAGGIAGGIGAGLGMGMFCLPKGTKIETDDGSKNVEDVRPGDSVKGGKVLATSCCLRPENHKFYLHKFDTGDVVMSDGHPYFDNLVGTDVVSSDSTCTHDILTDCGFYYVNGVKLGSTIPSIMEGYHA